MYKHKLKKDYQVTTVLFGEQIETQWIIISKGGKITVKKDYSWDGCSPKIKLFGVILGTPDGKILSDEFPQTYFASLVHDALYQHKKVISITRLEADLLPLDMLNRRAFKFSKLYFLAVRIFGRMFGSWLM